MLMDQCFVFLPLAHPAPGGGAQSARCLQQAGVFLQLPQGHAQTGGGQAVRCQRGQPAARGKAGVLGRGIALFKNGNLVSIPGKFQGCGDAGYASSHDGDLHGVCKRYHY